MNVHEIFGSVDRPLDSDTEQLIRFWVDCILIYRYNIIIIFFFFEPSLLLLLLLSHIIANGIMLIFFCKFLAESREEDWMLIMLVA